MKKKKGFVLVESIVAAVFVLGLSTFLIMNIIPLVGEYEKTLNYDSVDAKYDAHLIRKMILMDNACNVQSILSFGNAFTNKPKYYYFAGDDICTFLSHKNYCKKLLSADYLDVKEIIVTEYKGDALKKLKDIEYDRFSRQMQDYLKYMPTYDGYNSFYQFRNRIIVTFNDGSATNIEVLKPYSNESCTGGGGGVPVPPFVTISASPNSWTNQNIIITGSGQANVEGIDAYAFTENNPIDASSPLWTYVTTTKEMFTKTYTATKNGKYYFNIKDATGTVASEEIVIDYMDKRKPVCTLSGNKATCKDESDSNNPSSYLTGYAVGTSITTSSPTTSISPAASTFSKDLGYNEKIFVVDRAGNKSDIVTASSAPTHTVTYNCQVSNLIGYGNGQQTTLTYSEGSSIDLSLKCNNPSGRTFKGWKTTGDVLSSLTMGTSNITLTAVYKENGGGSTPDTTPPTDVTFEDRCVAGSNYVRIWSEIIMRDNSGGSGVGNVKIHYYWPQQDENMSCGGDMICHKETQASVTFSNEYSLNNQFYSYQVDVCDVAGNCQSFWHNINTIARRTGNKWKCN